MMGGMQFQAEHHLFPQIPFYRLPDAVPIIKEELAKLNKSIVYGPVIWIRGKKPKVKTMIKEIYILKGILLVFWAFEFNFLKLN